MLPHLYPFTPKFLPLPSIYSQIQRWWSNLHKFTCQNYQLWILCRSGENQTNFDFTPCKTTHMDMKKVYFNKPKMETYSIYVPSQKLHKIWLCHNLELEYLWFYLTFWVVILSGSLKLLLLLIYSLVMLQKWLEIHEIINWSAPFVLFSAIFVMDKVKNFKLLNK